MSGKISIDQIVKDLKCRVIHKGPNSEIGSVVASGLMSDVLTTEEEEILLVSNLTTTQVVRTADMVGAYGILITNGKTISDDTVSLAKDLNITLLETGYSFFEACYRLGKIIYLENE